MGFCFVAFLKVSKVLLQMTRSVGARHTILTEIYTRQIPQNLKSETAKITYTQKIHLIF